VGGGGGRNEMPRHLLKIVIDLDNKGDECGGGGNRTNLQIKKNNHNLPIIYTPLKHLRILYKVKVLMFIDVYKTMYLQNPVSWRIIIFKDNLLVLLNCSLIQVGNVDSNILLLFTNRCISAFSSKSGFGENHNFEGKAGNLIKILNYTY
jgi:hypothetical protein